MLILVAIDRAEKEYENLNKDKEEKLKVNYSDICSAANLSCTYAMTVRE